MKKHTIYHIDDNFLELVNVQKIIEATNIAEYQGSSTDAIKGFEFVKKNIPDIVLLDIEMPGIDGISFAKKIIKLDTRVVFLTNYTNYALDAFDCFALNYILKPLTEDKFRKLIIQLDSIIIKQQEKLREAQLTHFSNCAEKKEYLKRVFINTQKSIEVLQLVDISVIEAKGAYTVFHLANGTSVMSSKLLRTYSELVVTNPSFKRISRSYIINSDHLKRMEKTKKTITLIFTSNISIEIGKTNKPDWLNSLAI